MEKICHKSEKFSNLFFTPLNTHGVTLWDDESFGFKTQIGRSVNRSEEIEMFVRVFLHLSRERIEQLVDRVSPRKNPREEKSQGYRFVKITDRDEYLDYLNSIDWHFIKARVWAREGGQCHACGSCEHLQVHHVSYRLIGREWKDDFLTVVLLCKWCHEDRH